jgi:hypothetical protein
LPGFKRSLCHVALLLHELPGFHFIWADASELRRLRELNRLMPAGLAGEWLAKLKKRKCRTEK